MTENNLNPARELDMDPVIHGHPKMDMSPEPENIDGNSTLIAKKKKSEQSTKANQRVLSVLGVIGKLFAALLSIALTVLIVLGLSLTAGTGSGGGQGKTPNVTIMDKFDMFMTNEISTALEGIVTIEKVYWLSDSDQIAPEPNESNFGYTEDPLDLDPVLRNARPLVGGRELLFSAERPIWLEEGIHYYYDETILVITWKEIIDRVVYTISEVVIAHPSQFRRFLAGGEFGSDKQYKTTDMADSVNAVVASSGDFYKFRRNGIVVYDRTVQRFENATIDTCYIDEDGNMTFSRINEVESAEAAQKMVDENDIRFSLCFGPILVEDGVACPPDSYPIGEIHDTYSRMALCQKGELHYLLVNAAGEKFYLNRHTIPELAEVLTTFDVDKAYALDGGQTTVIAMQGEPINRVDFGYQRQISDIIYFATALPDGE